MDHFKGRGGGRGRRVSSSGNNNNGGIMGSGVFGMLGTTIHCHNSDNSYYCNFMKVMQVFIYLFIILAILYIVYSFLKKKSKY